ncbi:MAG: hypothetical protein MHPSP_003315, partial [Paramarteilia canceri]
MIDLSDNNENSTINNSDIIKSKKSKYSDFQQFRKQLVQPNKALKSRYDFYNNSSIECLKYDNIKDSQMTNDLSIDNISNPFCSQKIDNILRTNFEQKNHNKNLQNDSFIEESDAKQILGMCSGVFSNVNQTATE